MSRNEYLGIALGAAFGLLASLILFWSWPPPVSPEGERAGYEQADSSPYGKSTYHEIPKPFAQAASEIWDRTWEDPVAFYTFVLSVFTAGLGFATVRVWFVTKRLVNGADETARRELRAYVGVEAFDFEIRSVQRSYVPQNPSTAGLVYTDFINVTIKNFGQTPAHDVSAFCHIAPLPFLGGIAPGFDFEPLIHPVAPANIMSKSLLNQGQTEVVKVGIFDARVVWAAQQQRATLLVFGRVYYRDAFNRPWSTQFCRYWEPWHPSGARFVPHAEFNGEDSRECPY